MSKTQNTDRMHELLVDKFFVETKNPITNSVKKFLGKSITKKEFLEEHKWREIRRLPKEVWLNEFGNWLGL